MIAWIKCFFGYHKYYVIEHFSPYVRKLGCRSCNKQWGMSDKLRAIVPWGDDLEQAREEIRQIKAYGK